MKRWLLAITCIMLPLAVTAQSSTAPVLRMQLDKATAAPGETIQLRITLLAPTWFPKPPEYPSFEIPNLIVRLPEDASYPISERVDGDTWSGVARDYSLQPMVAGNFRIPARTIVVTYADPATSKPVTRQLETDEVLFASRVPAGAGDLKPFVAARSLVLKQEIDGDTLDLSPGDAFKRTVSARISGAAPVFLPRLIQPLQAGYLSAYPDEARVGEKLENGEPVGERIEQVTYVVGSGGSLVVPPIELRWWNLQDQRIETAAVDGFEVTARRSLADILRTLDWRQVIPLAFVLVIVAVVLARWWPRVRGWRQRRSEAYLASEAYAFKRAYSALHRRQFGNALNAVESWKNRLPRACGTRAGGSVSILMPLSAMLYRRKRQQPEASHWARASDALRTARRECRALTARTTRERALPPLNPREE